MSNVNQNIAKNIILLRKANKWTQSELADKLNYSDKSISKWERGDSIPDIEMLCEVAKVFNVSLEYLTIEHSEKDIAKDQNKKELFVRDLLILILYCVTVYFISTIVFIYPTIKNPDNASKFWVAYLYALPVCAFLCSRYAKKRNIWLMRMISSSILVWTFITAAYCTTVIIGLKMFWLLFLIGVPLQAAICLYYFWKRTF